MAGRTRDPDRPQRILREAARLFYEKGFHAVSVDEIGEAAGATGAAIYRHFKDKEELLSTLFDEAQDRYLLALPDPGSLAFDEHEVEVVREMLMAGLLSLAETPSVSAPT
jgi:AcrR family transcriptional regulator